MAYTNYYYFYGSLAHSSRLEGIVNKQLLWSEQCSLCAERSLESNRFPLYIEYCSKSLLLCMMSFTIAVRHTFVTLLLSLSLTPPGAGFDHPLPDLLLQSGRGRSLAVAPFLSLDLLCGTVYHLNFGSSTVVLHFLDDWSHITVN